jgi:hypothetical protein
MYIRMQYVRTSTPKANLQLVVVLRPFLLVCQIPSCNTQVGQDSRFPSSLSPIDFILPGSTTKESFVVYCTVAVENEMCSHTLACGEILRDS